MGLALYRSSVVAVFAVAAAVEVVVAAVEFVAAVVEFVAGWLGVGWGKLAASEP